MSWRARTCGHLYHGAGAPNGAGAPLGALWTQSPCGHGISAGSTAERKVRRVLRVTHGEVAGLPSGGEGCEALRLGVEFPLDRPWDLAEQLEGDAPAAVAPRARHGSVHEEGVDGLRVLRVENEVPELLGQDLGPPGVDKQGGIPDRQEAHGGRG